MTLTRQPDPTPDPPTRESNMEPTTREKSTTAARVAISSGPAASTVEAHRAKRNCNKLLPQAEEPMATPESVTTMPPPPSPLSPATVTQEAMMALNTPPLTQPSLAAPHPQTSEPSTAQEAEIAMPPPPPSPPPSTPVTPIVPMSLTTPPLTQRELAAPYPQLDPGGTPPPMTLPPHLNEKTPTPPDSPTPYLRTTVNTPQTSPNTPQDVEMTPAFPPSHFRPPSTPTQNALGLHLQDNTTTPILKMSTMSARLEELENDNSDQIGRRPAKNTLDKYTPGPMPLVQDAHPTAPFDNIDRKLVEEWDDHLGAKLIAVPFDTKAKDTDAHDFIHARILTAVAEITNAQEASVAAPRPKKNTGKSNRPPNSASFLIYNITAEQADLLLHRRVWSSRAITFRVTPFAPTCPTFLFTLRGFITTTPKDVFPIIKGVWKNDKTKDFAMTLANAIPENKKERVASKIDHLLCMMNIARLNIKEAGNTLNPRFNVYADSSHISHDEIWRRLRAFLITQPYASSMQGQATPQHTPYVCTCCHGNDHPRGLCPFPSVTGWNGPTRDIGGDLPMRRNGSSFTPAQRPQSSRFSSRS
ncbi:hypothetical protein EDB86DRAFT_2837340 [Lactarius hatsudake]|nr:hypothetical protein EDB86DRAFT_2837340 [Lactarius hatsudake]